jgi:putative hydrolase
MPGPFDDVPLFREIQRIMSSSSGPVNWELARQVAIATASYESGKGDPEPSAHDHELFEDAVRTAELQITQLTGMEAPGDLAHVETVRRATWVEENIASLREFVEPAAARIGDSMSKLEPLGSQGLGDEGASDETGVPEAADMASQMGIMLAQMSPLLLGAQVGQVLGYLGQNVLGQYDIALPRARPNRLLFVVPNIDAFEKDWSLDPVEFRGWVALHEVTHRFEFSKPWVRPHFVSLLDDFVETLEYDVGGLQERFGAMDLSDPQALAEAFGGEEAIFGAILDPEQRIKLARIQAFMSAAEGFADHVMHAIGSRMLASYSRIDEAMRRYRETETGDPVFERLLGIEMKREQYEKGRAFCDSVASEASETLLAAMWDSPDSLPSMPEIEEPVLWTMRQP